MYEEQQFEVTASDCCGNGCANCILDVKQHKTKPNINGNEKNIILSYSKYKLINRSLHIPNLKDVLDLHFKYMDMTKSSDFILEIPAGHHIMMRTPNCDAENDKTYILRPYSPYWVQPESLEFKILVNLKPNGFMSRYIDELHEGDEVEFRGPIGCFEHAVDLKGKKCIFMVTQGVAIAPTLPIIEKILTNEDDMCRIFHLSCFRNSSEMFFRDRLLEYNKYWNFKGRIYLAHENCGSIACTQQGWCTDQCEIFRKHVKYKELIYPYRLSIVDFAEICNGVPTSEKIIILCGTRRFQDYFLDSINKMELDVKKENIFLF